MLLGVARVESGFDPDARSAAGAHGIMQIRWPVTARHLGVRRVAELYNPCVNIDVGASYLRELLDRFSDPYMALAAYNYGPTRLQSSRRVPPSVRNYVERVLAVDDGTPVIAGDILINSFASRVRAEHFIDSLQRLVPGMKPRLLENRGSFDILLTGTGFTRLDHHRLSRLFDLKETTL